MDHRARDHEERQLTAERAAEWLVRLEKGDVRDRHAFLHWLRRSPEAVGETLVAASTDVVLRQLFLQRPEHSDRFDAESGEVTQVIELAPQPTPSRAASLGRRWLMSIGATLAAAAAAAFVFQPPFVRELLYPNVFTTSIGEQRAVELSDGSAIVVNAQSSVRVRFSETARDVHLTAGQAMFTVAKDASRPFRVHVGSSIVQAVGTKFDVRRRSDRVDVAVLEGTVRVSAAPEAAAPVETPSEPKAATRVTAGKGVVIAATGTVTPPEPINVAQVSAWQQRRLVFSDHTLAEIAEEFSRYNRTPQIRVEGEELRLRRFSGVFDADSPEALITYLLSEGTVTLDRAPGQLVIRPREGAFDAASGEHSGDGSPTHPQDHSRDRTSARDASPVNRPVESSLDSGADMSGSAPRSSALDP